MAIFFRADDKDAHANWGEFPLVLRKAKPSLISVAGIHVGVQRKFDFGRYVFPTGLFQNKEKKIICSEFFVFV